MLELVLGPIIRATLVIKASATKVEEASWLLAPESLSRDENIMIFIARASLDINIKA